MSSFLLLPPELRVKILEFCVKKDWLRVSHCCKQLHMDVKSLLWRRVVVHWKDLLCPITDKMEGVKLISCLRFVGRSSNHHPAVRIAEQEKEILALRSLNDLQQKTIAENFSSIITNCYPKEICLQNFILKDGLKLLSENIPGIKEFRSFDLNGCNWNHITELRFLKRLTISHCDIKDGHLREVGKLSLLERISISHCKRVTGNSFKWFADAPSLNTLTFVCNSEEDFHNPVGKLNSLTKLQLMCPCGNLFFAKAGEHLPKLQVLWLNDSLLDDTGIFFISKVPCLQELSLLKCDNLTGQGLFYISNMATLKKFVINRCKGFTFSEEGLHRLSKMALLQDLHILSCDSLKDDGLAHLSYGLPALKRLKIRYCGSLTDKALEHIAKFRGLEVLDIYCQQLTDGGLHHLLALAKLKEFHFNGYKSTGDATRMLNDLLK